MKALLVVLLVGCGGSMSGDHLPPGGGGGGGGDGGGDDDVDAPAPSHAGSVTIQSYTAEQPPGNAVVGGTASAGFANPTTPLCTTTPSGPCTIQTCTGTSTDPGTTAGTITVTGAQLPISLAPAASGGYTQVMFAQPLFVGGESLAVSATGGTDVPAFTGSVVAPAKIQITSPAKPDPYLSITRANGFTATWTGGGTGTVEVFLFATDLYVACKFPVASKSGTVPASVLAMLPTGQSGGYAMAAIDEAEVDAGDWAITLTGYYNAVWTDDSIVSGPTMVQ